MTFGSLFAGIGGLDLGLERAGMKCVWQVEIDDYCNRVLEKHWPHVKRYRDVREFPPEEGVADVDLICGGFPCQDISQAGKRIGLDGDRSGLWTEFARIIRMVRPRFVLVENVAALLVRGMGTVVGELAESGFDSEWQSLPAAAFGAPHIRDRVFLLAYTKSSRRRRFRESQPKERLAQCGEMANTTGERLERWHRSEWPIIQKARGLFPAGCTERTAWHNWATEPDVGRMAYGVPNRVDRLRGLGNAVVPQVAEWIGRQIVATEPAES